MTIHAARAVSQSVSPEDLLRRLVAAKEAEIADIVSLLPASERARLAFFCYARGHLHDIGLAVAATCDLPFLMQVAPSNAAAHTLFARSRERFNMSSVETTARRRPAITLAKSVMCSDGIAKLIASIDDDGDEVDLREPAAAEVELAPAAC
jgi:hypothetical protein